MGCSFFPTQNDGGKNLRHPLIDAVNLLVTDGLGTATLWTECIDSQIEPVARMLPPGRVDLVTGLDADVIHLVVSVRKRHSCDVLNVLARRALRLIRFFVRLGWMQPCGLRSTFTVGRFRLYAVVKECAREGRVWEGVEVEQCDTPQLRRSGSRPRILVEGAHLAIFMIQFPTCWDAKAHMVPLILKRLLGRIRRRCLRHRNRLGGGQLLLRSGG